MTIMKKNILLAIALTALFSCSSDEFVGDNSPTTKGASGAINFGFNIQNATRGEQDHATSAASLGNMFIVYGEKDETDDGKAPAAGKLVFKNYQVNYTASSANKTESNSQDWEYVGITRLSNYTSKVIPSDDETQTIKYWDYSASKYTFTAVSAKQTDITSGYVTIAKIQSKETDNKVYDKGYTITLTANADASKLYFADRKVITHTAGTDRNADNTYGGNVTFTFRNAMSNIRVAMYETIPGYTVKIKKFYYVDNATPIFADSGTGAMITEGTDKFYANVPNVATGTANTLTVTYHESGTYLNQPKFTTTASAANYIALGGASASATGLKADVTLSETITTPTYNETSGAYTPVFPQISNNKNMKVKLDYDLYNAKTGEIISVKKATAEVPAQYLQWKPNYMYTYIFKVSDNTNGSTGTPGTDPAGLYPITFDAIVIAETDGVAEYITTVSEPSITTFGAIYNNTDSKYTAYQSGKAEYQAQTTPNRLDIYATIMEGSNLVTPVLSGNGQNVKIYTVTTSNATAAPLTEDNVKFAIEHTGGEITATPYTTNVTAETSVPTENGSTVNVNAVKLLGPAAGVYAIEYTNSSSKKFYKIVTVVAGS